MNWHLGAKLAIGLAFFTMGSATLAIRAGEPVRAIHRSDVVFMYENPDLYDAYGCTVMGWAGHANREHIENAHQKGVRLFSVSVGFRTEFQGMIDFNPNFMDAASRNFGGEPFIVPWLWDHKYKGQPAWHWCTNSPLYRAYLESQLVQRMATGCDGLHIDDYTGSAGMVSWQAACFCSHCMAGFRDYLKRNLPPGKMAELGIADLETFDYRQFLLDHGVTVSDYSGRRASLPLSDEFLNYQVQAATDYVAAYHRRAQEIRGGPLALSVNSSLNDPLALVIARHLSYFCCEVHHDSSRRAVPQHPVYIYKLADGLDRPVAATASGQDWADVQANNLPGLVRTWIAFSYAHGHNFMAPHHQWCYTNEKGTHWYNGPTEEYAWMYRFVRANARLLDCYEAIAPVALVYDNAAQRRGQADIEPAAIALADRNVPFTIVVAGDDWLDYRLDPDRLAAYRAVIVPKDLAMDQPQREWIDRVQKDGRLVQWPDDAGLTELLPVPVDVQGSKHVGVVPRAIPGDLVAPVAIHLLNRQYNAANDTLIPQRDFSVRLRRDQLPQRVWSRAVLHAPQNESQNINVTCDDTYVTIPIPELVIWGIVELD